MIMMWKLSYGSGNKKFSPKRFKTKKDASNYAIQKLRSKNISYSAKEAEKYGLLKIRKIKARY